MAKWSSDTDTGFLQTLEKGPSALPTDLPQVGAVFEKSLGAGLENKIREAAERTRARADQKGSGAALVVDDLPGWGGLRLPGSELGLAEDRLDQARALIRESKFDEALRILAEVLAQRPGYAAALYLKGLCEFRLDHAETALHTIAPIIPSTPLSLDSQVRQLRAEIREKMTPDVVAQVFTQCLLGDADSALRRLVELVRLDPAVPIYHFLRVHVLLSEGRHVEAMTAVNAADPYCQGSDEEMLKTMQREILRRMLDSALEPARLAYRAQKWRKARKELERIRSQWGQEDLWRVFHGYLEALGGGVFSKGRQPVEVIPQGDFATVDRLHFLLVREELNGARFLMNQAHPGPARHVMMGANILAPHFPYLHYLLGQATYLSVLVSFAGEPPPLEVVEAMLEEAMQFARSGARDPEIKAAKGLIDSIEGARQAMAEVRAEQKRQAHDVALIRPLGEQFGSVMESAKDGLTSVEQYHQVRRQLRAIRGDIPAVRRNLVTKPGLEAIEKLGEVVDRNLGQLDGMEPEMKIAEAITGFQKRLQEVLSGTSALIADFAGMGRSLKELKRDVEAYQASNTLQGDAKQALDGLIGAIDRSGDEIAEAAVVNPFMIRFQVAFAPLQNRTTPLDYSEARRIKNSMQEVVADGQRILRTLSRYEARQNVQKIVEIAESVVAKIPI